MILSRLGASGCFELFLFGLGWLVQCMLMFRFDVALTMVILVHCIFQVVF